ncbi:COX15/CtaA family protein [Streptomyces xiaopingdaonensis]|uniref:COX15/CtaA family protein n=1 Tax=Streptomyces xiaopingdaonensis TaxID=1565415 RepID=UPI0002E9A0E1|nr:COX15/CtaA family protein [Streptomyces xiaopingdaonensis]
MPNLLEVVRNPIAYIAARWTPTQRTLQRASFTALAVSVLIVVTGGAVRLTGSGLGCDTWPKCSSESLVATSEMGVHGAIEFGNRMLTWVLSAAVGWTIVTARAAKPRRRGLTRLAWSQFWLVMANGVIGGVTVLTELNPYTVAGHFLLASALLTVTTLTWLRAREGDEGPRPLVGTPIKRLAWVLAGFTVALLVVGTTVTGSGPHAGDSSDVPRMPIDWESVARLHSALAWVVVALGLAVWLLLRLVDAPAGPRARTRELLLVFVAQGVIGYVQYFTDLPEVLVALHLLGSTLAWVAVLRLLLSVRERGLPPARKADARPTVPGQTAEPESEAVAAGR